MAQSVTEYTIAAGKDRVDFSIVSPKYANLWDVLRIGRLNGSSSMTAAAIAKELARGSGYVVMLLNMAYKKGLVTRIAVQPQPKQSRPKSPKPPPPPPPPYTPPPYTPPPQPAPTQAVAPLQVGLSAYDMVPGLMLNLERFIRQYMSDNKLAPKVKDNEEIAKLQQRYLKLKGRAINTDASGDRREESNEEWNACWMSLQALFSVVMKVRDIV